MNIEPYYVACASYCILLYVYITTFYIINIIKYNYYNIIQHDYTSWCNKTHITCTKIETFKV